MIYREQGASVSDISKPKPCRIYCRWELFESIPTISTTEMRGWINIHRCKDCKHYRARFRKIDIRGQLVGAYTILTIDSPIIPEIVRQRCV